MGCPDNSFLLSYPPSFFFSVQRGRPTEMAKPGPSSQTGLRATEKVIKLCIALLESAKSYPYYQ